MLPEVLAGIAGLGIGVAIGTLTTHWFGTKPLVDKIARLRYDGFRPETPIEPRPKTVPSPEHNET